MSSHHNTNRSYKLAAATGGVMLYEHYEHAPLNYLQAESFSQRIKVTTVHAISVEHNSASAEHVLITQTGSNGLEPYRDAQDETQQSVNG
jgi:hypothetical protein